VDRSALIDKLNEILRWEYAGLVQYTQFSFMVRGPLREVYGEFFRENGEEALGHAHKVGDKIVALGGVTTVERAEVKQSLDLNEMLEFSLEVECRHVALYTEAL
jgi:bacterioferritin